jgi:hypothetical protein
MGWYDDEEQSWLPEWAVTPLMWIGCLMVAVLPASVAIAFWNAVLPDASPAAHLVVYGISLGLMVAAIKPWTIR